MKRFAQIFLATLVACGLSNACNKPSTFGSEILPDEDNVAVEYTENFDIVTTSIRRDSVITYSDNVQFQNTLCGELNDPVFGKTRATVYSQLRLGTQTSSNSLDGAVIDSVVMQVGFSRASNSGFRRHFFDDGKDAGPIGFGVGIYRLTDSLERNGIYYSDTSFNISERLGGFRVYDIEKYTQPGATRTFVTLRLPNSLWDELVAFDSGVFASNVILHKKLDGIAFIPVGTDLSNEIYGMASLNLNGGTFITFHYHVEDEDGEVIDDGLTQILTINGNAVKTIHFDSDIAGSVADELTPLENDSLVFLQAASGWDVKVEFPNLSDLGNVAINNAELELVIDRSQTAIHERDYPRILIASYMADDGDLNIVQDVLSTTGNILSTYNGLVNFRRNNAGEVEWYYSINISKHLQRVLNGDFANRELYISVFNKQESASRVVLGGGSHTQIGTKLKLTYTNL